MRPLAPLAALLVLILAAGGARAPIGDAMAAPAWTPGDFWLYTLHTTFSDTVYLNGTIRAEISDLRTATVRGVAQDVFVADLSGIGTLEGTFDIGVGGPLPASGTWNLTGEEMFNADSRTIVRHLVTIDAEGTVELLDVPFTLRFTNSSASRVVSSEWVYPVPLGFSGAIAMNSSFAEDLVLQFGGDPPYVFSNTTETDHELIASLDATPSNVTIPAGTFETFTVREVRPWGGTERFDYAPAAGNNARTESFNESGGSVSRTELVAYRYRAGEPGADPTLLWVAGAGGTIAAAAGIVGAVLLIRRRRRRESEYTPPSLKEPPTSGP